MINIKKIINALLPEQLEVNDYSVAVTDVSIIEKFIQDESNTFLVSFPRTGSHWLRMIMELYFKRPSLVRLFYFYENTDYLTLHTHDMDLSVERENVIYLYRDPVETVYSQMNYYKEDTHDQSRIVYWSDIYGQHLDKWLYLENFTKKKTIITYEGLQHEMATEFEKIAGHFGEKVDLKRLYKASDRITREEVKKKTCHDPQVVQLASNYTYRRNEFKKMCSQQVWDNVLKGRQYLLQWFSHLKTSGDLECH